jgi:dihydroorotase
MNIAIINGKIINESEVFDAGIIICDGRFKEILREGISSERLNSGFFDKVVDASGKYILPGVIDDQVHFREPGLTHKGDIYTESKAAVAGGVTSFMDMPNVNPPSLTKGLLEQRYEIASGKSLANFSFYMGMSNDNLNEVLSTDYSNVCGVKIFLGSSTGNLLINDHNILNELFASAKCLIAAHCEDDAIIQKNLKTFTEKYGAQIPFSTHAQIRNEDACFSSSSYAVNLARKYGSRLHVLHLSSAKEMSLFDAGIPVSKKKITAEVCIHHLWFSDADYEKKGAFIKWNPSIKTERDRLALWDALKSGKIDVIATDHAPHTLDEKTQNYLQCPSGGPLVQHSLVAMLDFYHNGVISLPEIAKYMSHNPAECFRIKERGYIRPGYHADMVIVDLHQKWTVSPDTILYKCGWSPFENHEFKSKITHTFVNGNLVFENNVFSESEKGQRLEFVRN